MIAERPPTQRGLVDLPLQFSDRRIWVEHLFPFVDARWRVAFFLVDASLAWPAILRESVDRREGGLFSRSPMASLAPLGSVRLEELATLVHFDPWWVLRTAFPGMPFGPTQIPGVEPSPDPVWLEAYRASNIAVRFTLAGRRYGVTDLVFDAGLKHLSALEARTSLGRVRGFRTGEIDLTFLRRPVPQASIPAVRRP